MKRLLVIWVVCGLAMTGHAWAGPAAPGGSEQRMRHQLDALAANDRAAFIAHGNQAFREIMDAWSFDSLVMQRKARLSSGYRLEYLGVLKRLGMDEHIWRVLPNGYRYQLLGRLSVANGKVVGFMLE